MSATSLVISGMIQRNPAWVQMLGLCPLLAVSSSVVNAIGLAAASALVLIGSNTAVSLLRHHLPDFARLPAFMLLIAGLTTLAVMLLEAFAYTLYLGIALFVQIIVTNCMILARAEAFASRQPVGASLLDAVGTAAGYAIALLVMGCVREVIGQGTLFANADQLFGDAAGSLTLHVLPETWHLRLVTLPPGAFIIAGLLLALGRCLFKRSPNPQKPACNTP